MGPLVPIVSRRATVKITPSAGETLEVAISPAGARSTGRARTAKVCINLYHTPPPPPPPNYLYITEWSLSLFENSVAKKW